MSRIDRRLKELGLTLPAPFGSLQRHLGDLVVPGQRMPPMLAAIVVALASATDLPPAHASTSEAWAAHTKAVIAACTTASNLRGAKAAGSVIELDDRAGFSAVVIDGRYPQPHMKGKRTRMLCLFDKKARVAYVADAETLVQTRNP